MVVMVTVAARGLEARDAVADVDALDEPQRRERLERPVDARDPDGAALRADPPWISCAERQHRCSSRKATTAVRAPPRRRPAVLSPASAWSDQVICT